MATSKEFVNYFWGQFSETENVSVRPMMGEYLLYFKGKLIGDICDNTVFLKPAECIKMFLPVAEFRPPYKGARDMAVFENFEDRELAINLFNSLFSELPDKPKKKGKNK